MDRDFPCTLCHDTRIASPTANTLHQHSPSVTINEPTSIHHYPPKSRVYMFTLGFTFSVVYSMGNLDKCIMIRICKYSIIQNSFTASNILCVLSIQPWIHTNTWQLMTSFSVFMFCLFQNVI
jgi:hypothetical protein